MRNRLVGWLATGWLLAMVGCQPTGQQAEGVPSENAVTGVAETAGETVAEAAGVTESAAISADGTPGLPVGSEAPKFTLSDQAGEAVHLSSLLEQGNVALVFYRSADW